MFEANRKALSGQKSISQHPLFPAIVALWFSALFGLGSLAVGASVIPGLERPLGFGERVALALALAAIGGFLGVMLARRLTSRRQERARRAPYAESAVFDELEGAMERPGRRRALTAQEDSQPLVEEAEDAPALEDDALVLDLVHADGDALAEVAPVESPAAFDAVEPVRRESPAQAERVDAAAMEHAAPAETGAVAAEPEDSLAWLADVALGAPAAHAPEAVAPDAAIAPAAPAPALAVAANPAAVVMAPVTDSFAPRVAYGELSTLSAAELIDRLALAIARSRAARASAAARDAAFAHAPASLPTAPQHDEVAAVAPASLGDSQPETAPLRLTIADITAPRIETPAVGDSVVAAWPAKAAVPQAFRPIGLTEIGEDAEDLAADISAIAPPRKLEMTPAPVAAAAPRDFAADHDEGPIVSRQAPFARPLEAFSASATSGDDTEMRDRRFGRPIKTNAAPARRPFISIEDLNEIDDIAQPVAEPAALFPRAAMVANAEFTPVSLGPDHAAESAASRIAGVIAPIAAPAERQDPPAAQPHGDAAPAAAPAAAHGAGGDMAETERALRSALASLQRISGAA